MLQAPPTSPTLLFRLRSEHDEEAWREFVEFYAPAVFQLCRQRGLQDADAADVSQEVLRSVAAGPLQYDPKRGAFRSWLYGVARNKLNDFLRRRSRHPSGSGDSGILELINNVASDEDEAERWEKEYQKQLFSMAADKVRAIVDESTWQAFWQTAIDGRTARDVAQALGMSEGAVYVAKSRVVARIKNHVTEIEGTQQ
jgi:RNA polymerase sigma-70 factor (ECF subfamily)